MSSDKLKKGEVNKITQCLDAMSAVDTYDERYEILREFTLDSYKAGSTMALDEMSKQMKEMLGCASS